MSLDELQAQLRATLDQHFSALKSHHEQALGDAKRDAAADAERELRSQLESHYEQVVADARSQAAEEAERALQAKLVAHYEQVIAETKRQASEHAERESQTKLASARAEWEDQLNARLAAVRAEGERAVADAQKAAADAAARLRAELEEARDVAIATVRRSAEVEFESERRRAAREVEAERERGKVITEEAQTAIDNERARAKSALDALREQLGIEVARAQEIASREQAAAESAREAAARETDAAAAAREAAARDVASANAARDAALRDLAAAEAARDAALGNVAAAEAARDAALRDVAAAEAAKDAALRDAAATTASTSAANTSAPVAAMYERVATGIRTMDAASTLGAALDALVESAGAIAGRSALFLVDGDRLKAWKSDVIPDVDVQAVESPIGGDDLLACAIQTAQPTLSGPTLPAPPFARLAAGQPSLAVPLLIAGRAVAVLYVDAGTDAPPSPAAAWQGAIDLLSRHASALLALRTAMRTFDMMRGGPEPGTNGDGEEAARRYAKLLVSEIKLYNEGAVRVGRQQHDLLRRLSDEIGRAQRLYEERVPPGVRARDSYFKQELVQTLADGDEALLGN